MSFDVFISYSTKDATAAKAACAALEASKIRCWMAPRDIVAGARWGASIVRAINQCRVMVLIFSGNANASAQVQREADQAFSRGKVVVPLRIEDVKPTDELAYYLDSVHWLDALTPPLEKSLAQLVTTVQALLSAAKQAPATSDFAIDEPAAAHAADEARAQDERSEHETQAERHIAGPAQPVPEAVQARPKGEEAAARRPLAEDRTTPGTPNANVFVSSRVVKFGSILLLAAAIATAGYLLNRGVYIGSTVAQDGLIWKRFCSYVTLSGIKSRAPSYYSYFPTDAADCPSHLESKLFE